MRLFIRWFSSLKLTVWILTILIGVFFLGSYLMPLYPGAHAGMNDMPLVQWWWKSGKNYGAINGWLPLSVLLLLILTLNTLVCTLRSIRPGPSIWAHITHLGFLVILVAHLVSAAYGFREGGIVLIRGRNVAIPKLEIQIELNRINYEPYPGGMPKNYSADVTLIANGERSEKRLGPNKPAFYQGIPIYLKNLGFRPVPYAVCEVAHDPGALVALAGSIIFLIGSMVTPFVAHKPERGEGQDDQSII
jgi:cytochrome c biogenesis protein ResB